MFTKLIFAWIHYHQKSDAFDRHEAHPLCWGTPNKPSVSQIVANREKIGITFKKCCIFGDKENCFDEIFTEETCCTPLNDSFNYCAPEVQILIINGDNVDARGHESEFYINFWDYAHELYHPNLPASSGVSSSEFADPEKGDPVNIVSDRRWKLENLWRMISGRQVSRVISSEKCVEVAELASLLLLESRLAGLAIVSAGGAPPRILDSRLKVLLSDWDDFQSNISNDFVLRTGLVDFAKSRIAWWVSILKFGPIHAELPVETYKSRLSWLPIYEASVVPISDSRWVAFHESWMLDRRIVTDEQVAIVHHEFYNSLYEIGVHFDHVFPTQGSLIGYLRHGRLQGELSDGIFDIVDLDLDLVAIVNNRTAGYDLCYELFQVFKKKYRNWAGCYWQTTECACLKQFDDLSTFWSNLVFRIPSDNGLQLAQKNNAKNTPNITNGTNSIVSGSIWVDEFVIEGTNLIQWKEAGDHLPFEKFIENDQNFNDDLGIPAGVIYPVTKCSAYDSLIACPKKPWQFLTGKHQDGDDYFKSCLATPYYGPTRNSHDPRNIAFLDRGMTQSDLEILEARWKKMDSQNVMSMLEIWESKACEKERKLKAIDINKEIPEDEMSIDVPTSSEIGTELGSGKSAAEKVEFSFFARAMEDSAYNSLCFGDSISSAPFHKGRLDRSEYCCGEAEIDDCFDKIYHSKESCCVGGLHQCAQFVPRHFADWNVITDDIFRDFRDTVLANVKEYKEKSNVENSIPFEGLIYRTDLCPIVKYFEQNIAEILNVCAEVLVLSLAVGVFVDVCDGAIVGEDFRYEKIQFLNQILNVGDSGGRFFFTPLVDAVLMMVREFSEGPALGIVA